MCIAPAKSKKLNIPFIKNFSKSISFTISGISENNTGDTNFTTNNKPDSKMPSIINPIVNGNFKNLILIKVNNVAIPSSIIND